VALKTTGSLTWQHGIAFPKPRQAIGDVSMRKPNGRLGPLVLVAACAAVVAGCKEEFVDQQFGVLDLASVYDGGTTSNPAAGVPDQINPQTGYVDGEQAQYYDFGSIPVKRNPLTNEPLSAGVNPMYFFFDTSGHPLFSRPVRETRDGTDWMRGGVGVVNPNPKDYCLDPDKTDCKKNNDAEKKKPYGVRARNPLPDKARGGSTDYQRPLVDVSPGDQSDYTGLWEIYEVIVADGYAPDSIKHKATMDRAVAAGKMVVRSTQKVINCPMIDERTLVTRGVTDRATPHPRIELWYRRQLTFCFLANGWETIGTGADPDVALIPANSDGQRVDTFDVDRLAIGDGSVKQMRLVVPISRAYVPTVLTSDQANPDNTVTPIADNVLTRGRPRRTPGEVSGYTPIRWMWDLQVGADYVQGGLTSVDDIDLTNADTRLRVRNLPMRGVALKCGWPPDLTHVPDMRRPNYHRCGHLVHDPAGGPDILDATADEVCTKLGLECNSDTCYCDAPFVGYGQVCGPGVAQCNPKGDAFNAKGYTCLFPFGGYCYMRCDPKELNERAAENMGKKATEYVDTRCKSLPGYRCLGYLGAGICLRVCDSNVSDPKQCSATTPVDMMDKDIGAGQTCQDLGVEVCSWPDGYTPAE
jgi:hypothetical protein